MAKASPVTLSKLVSRHEVAERTTAFRFEKPSNWTFKAGQFLEMTLLDPSETDAEGNTRTFSIASAPHEETVTVATRIADEERVHAGEFLKLLHHLAPEEAKLYEKGAKEVDGILSEVQKI